MEHANANGSLSGVIEAAYERHPENFTTAADHAVMLISGLPDPLRSQVTAKLIHRACREMLHDVTERLREEVKRRGDDTHSRGDDLLNSEVGRSQQGRDDTQHARSARPARRPVGTEVAAVVRKGLMEGWVINVSGMNKTLATLTRKELEGILADEISKERGHRHNRRLFEYLLFRMPAKARRVDRHVTEADAQEAWDTITAS